MSPGILRALSRQLRSNREAAASGFGHLYEPPLAEHARSADWYKQLLWSMATPPWLRR